MNDVGVHEDLSLEELVAVVADEFRERLARGERVNIEEFVCRHPDHGDILRDLLATLEMVSAAGHEAAPLAGRPRDEALGCLGDFRIVREIGRGGMGIVYEAEQISLRRKVALKVLPFAAALDARHLQRFQNEAQAAAHLHHPHIVPVYGVGSERGTHYYVMQYIEGQTLAALIEEMRRDAAPQQPTVEALSEQYAHGPAPTQSFPNTPSPSERAAHSPAEIENPRPSDPPSTISLAGGLSTEQSHRSPAFFRTAARLGMQAAEALEHSHRMGIIHRDIKPANLLLDVHGELWITDFGLAQMRSDARLTMTGDLVGTLRYMSPEQALGKRIPVDHRTDIYSLGATLYELLTLTPVFGGTDRQELLRKIAFEEPRAPRRANRAIPPDLETIVLKAIAKNPQDRYATAQEIADDLQRFLEDKPILARRPTLLQRARKFARRHRPMVLTAAVSFTLLTLGLLVSSAVAYYRTRDALDQARTAEKKEADQRFLAERERDIARQTLHLAKMHLVRHAWDEGKVGRMLELLDEQRPRPSQKDWRGWEWYYFRSLARQDLRTLKHPQELHGVAWSPDGKYLASWDARAVAIWEVESFRQVQTLQAAAQLQLGDLAGAVWSPDSRHLAVAMPHDGLIQIWEASTGKETVRLPGPKHGMALSWSDDGRFLSTNWEKTVRTWEVKSGTEQPERVGPHSNDFAWSADRTEIAAHRVTEGAGFKFKWSLMVFDAKTGKELRRSGPQGPRNNRPLVWSPRGAPRRIAQGGEPLVIWDADSLEPIRTIPGYFTSLAWSPDGRRLAAAGGNQETGGQVLKIWDVETGDELFWLRGHTGRSIAGLSWSPDGTRLASASSDKTVKIWDVANPPHPFRPLLPTEPSAAGGATWSRDGRLATGTYGEVWVWDPFQGQPPFALREIKGSRLRLFGRNWMAWDPDGRRLAAACEDGPVRVWDVSRKEEVACLHGHTHGKAGLKMVAAAAVAWSPDGRRLATGGRDHLVKIWDVSAGKKLFTLLGHTDSVSSVAWSPDGSLLATAGADKTVRLWDAAKGELVANLEGHTKAIWKLLWSPNGRLLLSLHGGESDKPGEMKVWDTATRKEQYGAVLPKGNLKAVAWSPDSKRFATGGWISKQPLMIWDPITASPPVELRGHPGVYDLAWSPDGGRLASGGTDSTVRIWDVGLGQEMLALRGHRGTVAGVTWTPDGRRLISTGGNDATIRVWDASPAYGEK